MDEHTLGLTTLQRENCLLFGLMINCCIRSTMCVITLLLYLNCIIRCLMSVTIHSAYKTYQVSQVSDVLHHRGMQNNRFISKDNLEKCLAI